MSDRVTVVFNSLDLKWSLIRALFIDCGLSSYAEQGADPLGVYVVKLDDGTVELACITRSLEAHGLSYTMTRERRYAIDELRASPMLRVVVRRAPKGTGGPRYGTEYDLSTACQNCGAGARQVSELVLNERELPRRGPIVETFTGETLVSGRLREELQALDLHGLELRDVLGHNSRQPLDFAQLIASDELPPMDATTVGLVRDQSCVQCDRDGYFESMEEPLVIRYAPEIELKADAYFTYERFGYSKLSTRLVDSRFAPPLLLVSQNVFEAFERARVPGVKFEPVTLRTVQPG